jgi:hypothetical protein
MGGLDDRFGHEPSILLGVTELNPIVGLEIAQRGGRLFFAGLFVSRWFALSPSAGGPFP